MRSSRLAAASPDGCPSVCRNSKQTAASCSNPTYTPAKHVLRDGDVGRGDDDVPGSGGKELRHVEARRATDDRADVRFADQAAELVDAARAASARRACGRYPSRSGGPAI